MRMRAVLLPLRIPQQWGLALGIITALVCAGIGLYGLLRPDRIARLQFRPFPIVSSPVFQAVVRLTGALILLLSVGFLVMLILSVFG